MAKIRFTNTLAPECPPEFKTDPTSPDDYELVDPQLLAQACANFKALIDDPDLLTRNSDKLVRATFFPVSELVKAIEQTQSAFLKVYYAVLDETDGKHFMFMSPVDAAGMAIDNAAVVLPACIGTIPPCPRTFDRYIAE